MKKCFMGFSFLLTFFSIYSQNYKIETDILPPDHPNAKQIEKIDYYYDLKSNLVKAFYYFKPEWSKENGPISQIEYYENNIPVKFELNMSTDFTNKTNIVKKIDFVDKEDNITKIILTTKEGKEWSLIGDSVNNYDKFKINRLDSVIELFNDAHNLKESDFVFETPIYPFMSEIKFTNKIEDLSKKEIGQIQNWLKLHKADQMLSFYKKKMNIDYKKYTFILCLQNEFYSTMDKYSSGLFCYYYIGGYKNTIFLLGISYIGSKN